MDFVSADRHSSFRRHGVITLTFELNVPSIQLAMRPFISIAAGAAIMRGVLDRVDVCGCACDVTHLSSTTMSLESEL